MTNLPKAFILVGPTASGKSAIAQWIAEQTGASIVSADSMNIYRGMDIGTAKPSPAERAAVVYHGINLADPTNPFSVGDWLNAVRPVFQGSEDLIVAGGTGLYVKCLLQGLDDLPAADDALRARAEKMSLAELQAEARDVAPAAYAALADNENPRRLVRLLEKFPMSGSVDATSSSRFSNAWKKELPTVVGLHVEREILIKRIVARVEKMYAGGLLEEARGLTGLELSVTAQKAIGYAEAFAVLRGEMTEAQAKERTVIRTRQLAKRQATWFRTQLNVQWMDVAQFPTIGKIAEEVSNVWKNCGPVPLAGARL